MCRRFALLPPSAFVRSLCTPACVYNEPLRKMSGVGSLPYSHVTITCSILVSIIIIIRVCGVDDSSERHIDKYSEIVMYT